MAILRNGSVKKYAFLHNGTKLKKALHNSTTVLWKAGSTVTYYVDTNTVYTEEVDSEASCLSPKTFTPAKSGWTFVGWREDKTASSSVLTSKVMGDSPITLYAVFRVAVTLAYAGNGATSGSTASQSGYRYYNNGNAANPSFTLKANGFAKTNYTFTKWAIGSASGTQYAVGASVTLTANTTFYAVWMASSLVVYQGTINSPNWSTTFWHTVSVSVNNKSYITMPTLDSSSCGLGTVATSGGESDITRNIAIKYNGYKSAMIEFTFATDNARSWETDQIARAYINGALVYNTYNETTPASYSLTTSSTSIPVRALVSCAESNDSSSITIACKITLKM